MVKPLSPGRYKVQFTASAALRHKLERLRALMGAPAGDLAAVIEQAVTEKLERLEARRFSQTKARQRKSGVGDAPSATGWNSTTGTRSASAVTTAWRTSR